VYRWELDNPALYEFAALGQQTRAELARFLDALVIADPAAYQRRHDEGANQPVRMLHFGPDHEGLVTLLIYPPDQLVLVVRVQWLGD
jgi:hypothetical protein